MFNINPNNLTDPVTHYKTAVKMLAEFENLDIEKIITSYLSGEMWNSWDSEKRQSLIKTAIQELEDKQAKKQKRYQKA